MTPLDPCRSLPFDLFDARRYRTLSVEEGYARWSRTYGEFDRRYDLQLLERCAWLTPAIAGRRVADLGCGTGRIGAWLMARGAKDVVGVDLSPEMLAEAARRGCYAALHRADMTRTPLDTGAFDGAISSMALCHVADLDAFYTEAGRLVRAAAAGWLVVVDYHPFFMLRGVPTHFDDQETGESVAIANHVHMLSAHVHAGTAAGFAVRAMQERLIDEPWVASSPGFAKHLGWPVTFLLAFQRGL